MSVQHKILRTANAPTSTPDETETSVAQALIDLENNVPELKAELRPLQISAAREVDVRGGKKAIVIFVPVPQLKAFHKVQARLTRELEKKFAERHVVFVAQRRMLRKPTRTSRVQQKRPRSRTLTSVHEKILEDLVFPTEIVGKRTRVSVDGSKLLKVFLDSKDATSLEYKLDSFSSVYRRLTGKDVVFEFPVTPTDLCFPSILHNVPAAAAHRARCFLTTPMPLSDYAPLDSYGKSRYDYESRSVDAKIVVMGNTGVGKTSLLQRYTQNKFDPKNTTSTTGAFFVTKKVYVDGLKVRLQLWDTAGQERFRSMAPMYYRGANAALLLYDITNASTFDDVRGWLEVGSKADLNRSRQVTPDRVRLSLARWFPPPPPPSPPAPITPHPSTLSYIRPRFTSFTPSRSVPVSSLAPKAMDDNSLSRPSELRRSTTAFPRITADWAFSNGQALSAEPLRRANSSNTTSSSRRQKVTDVNGDPVTRSRFGSYFGLRTGTGGFMDGLDGSSNSVPEEDEIEGCEDDREWGLEKDMSLFEVSSKDDRGVKNLFDTLISAIIQRKDAIERENELKKRDSVMLTSVPTPTWSAQADEEEKALLSRGSPWSCCQT
ncbi:hypothetical protein EW145_g3836 [Phellinidium pouzarii]|uniref:40S ribosomal protein S7 n=1 Tax=Phellinidium pouzarii TaxID=167371 RepID=A0A4S4L756_9AGAM|nr:hypothetical protein EW145_g3836 [Phellinidium pouzarii]